jgi:hypothetical protein
MLKINGQIVKTPESEYGAFVAKLTRQMETITITERDLRTLERLRVKRRSDCLAAFSVNEKREIWMYATRGWTKLEQREYVECPAVERIAEVYLSMRPQGGRVFLRREGLFDREFGVGFDHQFANVNLPHGWAGARD